MENLTPAQRIATIAIGLVLTVAFAIFVLPWAGDKIESMIPPTKTPLPATPTATPTHTPTPTLTPTSTPTLAITPPAPAVLLEPVDYQAERTDYCSLAPLGIALTYWGTPESHDQIEEVLCPGKSDTFVSTDELADYAASRRLKIFVGVNGDQELLHSLLSNGFPVIVTRWSASATGASEAGRYEFVRGYDQVTETLTIHDFAIGPDVDVPAAEFDASWRVFNRQYVVIYPAEQETDLNLVLAQVLDSAKMWEAVLARAEAEIAQDEADPFAWLNKGDALLSLDRVTEAQEAFARAREIGLPVRLYRFRYDVFDGLLAVQDYQGLVTLTQTVIADGAAVEEIHLYRAQAYEGLGDNAKARAEYNRALELHPDWTPAVTGLSALSD
ncbi:MAG: tetratricopeptide repeat protein [Anaerolineae bacterium]|nr:tetratricopeptide repeat protein [Anaerolineae bacterium]